MRQLWPHPRSLIMFFLVSAFTAHAFGQSYIDVTCKGAIAMMERGNSVAGIRCEAKGLHETFLPRWTATNEEHPSKPSYTSSQQGFFFPANDEWMVIGLTVETPADTVYLPRVKARRVNGRAELARYTPGDG